MATTKESQAFVAYLQEDAQDSQAIGLGGGLSKSLVFLSVPVD